MPQLIDNLISQLREKYGQQWEFAMPGQSAQGQGQLGGVRSAADARELARVGSAAPTLSNIGQAAGLGLSHMSGLGAITTGAQGLAAQTDLGKRLGIESPYAELDRFTKTSPEQMATITSDNPAQALNQGRKAQRESYRQAVAERERRAKANSDRASAGHRGGGFGRAGSSGKSSRGNRGE